MFERYRTALSWTRPLRLSLNIIKYFWTLPIKALLNPIGVTRLNLRQTAHAGSRCNCPMCRYTFHCWTDVLTVLFLDCACCGRAVTLSFPPSLGGFQSVGRSVLSIDLSIVPSPVSSPRFVSSNEVLMLITPGF